ncbi:hypothetical protein EDC01DRAFT_643407 [Geopyxis carbonaria]|nr:hypothetical protein EDC01DRAFT_643407 [Geopyxis carbonaria]
MTIYGARLSLTLVQFKHLLTQRTKVQTQPSRDENMQNTRQIQTILLPTHPTGPNYTLLPYFFSPEQCCTQHLPPEKVRHHDVVSPIAATPLQVCTPILAYVPSPQQPPEFHPLSTARTSHVPYTRSKAGSGPAPRAPLHSACRASPHPPSQQKRKGSHFRVSCSPAALAADDRIIGPSTARYCIVRTVRLRRRRMKSFRQGRAYLSLSLSLARSPIRSMWTLFRLEQR